LNTSGKLVIADADTGEAIVVAKDFAGTYGTFHVNADGSWTYTGNGAHNELTVGQVVSDSITVTSVDGTATGSITVNVTGTNDAATVSSQTKAVTEADASAALNTSGKLLIADADTGEAIVVAKDFAGTYGTFHVNADGSWTYTGNGAHDELTAGQVVSDSITVTSVDGTATGSITVNVTGTNDAATVSSQTKAVTEADASAALNTSGKLVIADADTGEAIVVAKDFAGTYGTFHVNADGSWTYTGNGAHNELTVGQVVSDSITVTSVDGTATGSITVNVTGTNDTPVMTASTKTVAVTQGAAAVADVSANIGATDPDGGFTFSLVESTDLFTINSSTGVISLTTKGAEAVSALSGAGTLPEYTLNVVATDANGAVSVPETVTVNVNMAVQAGGTTASLPGSMSDWSIAPSASTNGFVLTNHADPLIQVSLPNTVTSLNFTGGDSVALSNNGSIGSITYNAGTSNATHTITVAPGTTEGTLTVLGSSGVHVEGAASSSDGIQVTSTFDVTNLNATFSEVSNGHITMHTAIGDTIISDVEYVQFVDPANSTHVQTVRIVGAGGYATLADATAAAASGDVIYVTDASLASGATNGVINHTDLSIYIAKGEGAQMALASSLTGAEVRIYGDHSFSLVGSSGNDNIHDFTQIGLGMTNTISGGDGSDKIVAHNNTLGTELLQGGGGNDILIGGDGAQLQGGDGADILLALGGAAALSGGAGNDVLLNAYASAQTATNPTNKAVVMSGGAGSDVFGLIGTSDANASGAMKTIVADLGTGDSIDLSFLEKMTAGPTNSADVSLSSTADLSGGKATMTTSGTTLNLNSFVATSSEASAGDVNSHVTGGTMTISNATLTKASAAINAGIGAESTIDFSSTFGPLTDTYGHH
jgi:VCBS repeat-containing protein